MELKQINKLVMKANKTRKREYQLLIVPYGIETIFCPVIKQAAASLLIVPYGIETTKVNREMLSDNHF